MELVALQLRVSGLEPTWNQMALFRAFKNSAVFNIIIKNGTPCVQKRYKNLFQHHWHLFWS